METKQLLSNTREKFIKKYSQTPEQAGFHAMNCWQDKVMLSTDQEVFISFCNNQNLIRKTINEFCFALLIFALGTEIALISFSPSSDKFMAWVFVAMLGLIVLAIINIKRKLLCNRLEAVYLKEHSHLMFDGKNFYELKREPVNPHTAFF